MAYSDIAEITSKIPESIIITLSNDIAGAATIDETNVDEAIEQADREIDAYISMVGHEVPLTVIPPIIVNLSARMAIWNLHKRKYFKSEVWEKDYEKCEKILLLISTGKLTILPTVAATPVSVSTGMATESRHRKFTHHRAWEHF
jgi:phage gp36-like protein